MDPNTYSPFPHVPSRSGRRRWPPGLKAAGLALSGAVLAGTLAVAAPAGGATCTVTGTMGDDILTGTAGADVVCGLGGNDTLLGLGGNDTLDGGPGDDAVYGGPGNDWESGGDGNDTFRQDAAANGADKLVGGAGVDRVSYSARTLPVRVDLDGVADDGQADEADRVGADVENASGGAGADALTGNLAANVLAGGAGDDAVAGGDGDDTLVGGAGDDALDGGAGTDACDASSGADQAVGCEGGGAGTNTGSDAVLLAAGDIARCSSLGDEATAALLDRNVGAVATLGDNAYDSGTAAEFENCYGPTWGRHKARTRPAAGNHEYKTPGAAGYFGYFGATAGDPAKGYYSYEVGAWHVVALNSNCYYVGGCGAGSAQEQWLRRDLAAHPAKCTLAYWHHPRWSSGHHGSNAAMEPAWRALHEAGADLVLAGHDHGYERFAPLGPSGQKDATRGIRSMVVGTGGASLYPFADEPLATSEVRDATSRGVLKLTLRATGYDWKFLPVAGKTFTDAGSGACH